MTCKLQKKEFLLCWREYPIDGQTNSSEAVTSLPQWKLTPELIYTVYDCKSLTSEIAVDFISVALPLTAAWRGVAL